MTQYTSLKVGTVWMDLVQKPYACTCMLGSRKGDVNIREREIGRERQRGRGREREGGRERGREN